MHSREACQEYRSSRTCDLPCSQWSCGLCRVRISLLWYFGWIVYLLTFPSAVLADIRGSLGAFGSRVTFLGTDTTRSLEHTRLGAFDLVMARDQLIQRTVVCVGLLTLPRHS